MADEDFEWEDWKAASNFAKHDVTFETARPAFDDPNWVESDDADPNEARNKRICMHEGRVYVVIYIERGTRIRIIIARRANNYEQNLYFG